MSIVPNKGINTNQYFLSYRDTFNDLLEKFVQKYKNYPYITDSNKHMTNSELAFTFQLVTKNRISKLINLILFYHC